MKKLELRKQVNEFLRLIGLRQASLWEKEPIGTEEPERWDRSEADIRGFLAESERFYLTNNLFTGFYNRLDMLLQRRCAVIRQSDPGLRKLCRELRAISFVDIGDPPRIDAARILALYEGNRSVDTPPYTARVFRLCRGSGVSSLFRWRRCGRI